VIKYLGSKRTLLPRILDCVRSIREDGTVVDLFSGTSRVGHALKGAGYRVLANDNAHYAATLAGCYVAADREDVEREVLDALAHLSAIEPAAGWFTRTYCEASRYFHPTNGARIEAIRTEIETMNLRRPVRDVVLTSLLEAADRVDSTTGVQMAYLKQWAPRALRPLALRMPDVLPRAASGAGGVTRLDALEAARALRGHVAYLDPPYNQHKYLGNYHVWETLVRWDDPEVYGVACKRVDTRTQKSPFNSRPQFRGAFDALVDAIDCDALVVSFSDEGFLHRDCIEEILRRRGRVEVHACAFRRYVGARIGIYNPEGQKVGRVSHTENTELLFVVRR
jgi:adenine-specific DNA-methyltransferase